MGTCTRLQAAKIMDDAEHRKAGECHRPVKGREYGVEVSGPMVPKNPLYPGQPCRDS